MAKTLLTMRTQVRSYLDETASADWTDAELNRLINTYYHMARSAVVTVYEDYYLTITTFNSVADQQEYGSAHSAPTDVYKIRRVELDYDVSASNNAPTRCLPLTNIDDVRRDLAYENSGLGLGANSYGNYYTYGFGSNFKIGFIPVPDKNGTNAIKIWYIKEATDLSSDSSELDIPYVDKNWILVAWGATAEALRFGQQESEEASNFEKKYLQGVGLMQEELEDKISEETKYVSEVTGDNLTF